MASRMSAIIIIYLVSFSQHWNFYFPKVIKRVQVVFSWILEVKFCNLIMGVFLFNLVLLLLCLLTYFFISLI